MRLEQYITEKASKNMIIVDIQPEYEHVFKFKMWEFTDFLNTQAKDILYFYNGEGTGFSSDSDQSMKNWLFENDLDTPTMRKIQFVDKGYGFFRSLMDEGVDKGLIIKAIRHMFKKKVWDSRDIDIEEWENVLDGDVTAIRMLEGGDMISIPDINLSTLKKFSGAYIMGGGKNECLAEVELLMSAFNIRATQVRKYIY